MKRCIEVRASSALGLLVFALCSACHVVVEKSDETGGRPAVNSESGGSTSAEVSGGSANGGSSAATGGVGVASGGLSAAGAAAGGVSATSGGSQSATSGGSGGGVSAPPSDPYVEACGSAEPVSNDERADAVDLAAGATICLEKSGDHDWFFLDTPNDGKAHVIQLDFEQEPNAWFSLNLIAKKDGSDIGSARLESGTSGTAYLTVGPGARTLFDFSPIVAAAALTTIKASLTTENDSYEPNNVRDAAATIQAGREISAQFLVPYVSIDQQAAVDWYKLDLAPGTHVFKLTSVPEDLFIHVDITDSARVAIDSGRAPNTGATFEFSFEVAKAGSYVFSLNNVVSVPVLMIGAKRHFVSEQYKFQID